MMRKSKCIDTTNNVKVNKSNEKETNQNKQRRQEKEKVS